MKKDAQKIAEQIKRLVDQLAGMSLDRPAPGNVPTKVKAQKKKGATGAITMLIEEGFFDSPKYLSEIMSKLEEIGHWHKRTAVSMNLLNLTKRRIFNRIKDKQKKKWRYVIRR